MIIFKGKIQFIKFECQKKKRKEMHQETYFRFFSQFRRIKIHIRHNLQILIGKNLKKIYI